MDALVGHSVTDLPMRPWVEIEPDAEAWAKGWYAKMDRAELRIVYGLGARKLTDAVLRNRLVKRHVRDVLNAYSRDIGNGRPVRGMSNEQVRRDSAAPGGTHGH
jgi:hypothetical protein